MPQDPLPISASLAVMTTTVLPEDTNAYGNIFGGQLLAWIDKTAAISAFRHARRNVVTASIDRVDFIRPVRLGDIVTVSSAVRYVGRSSMEVSAEVESELRRHFGALVFDTTIPRSVRLAEAPSYGVPAITYDRRSAGAEAYWKVAMELVERS